MITVFQNNIAEWSLNSSVKYDDPFNQVKVSAYVTDPAGTTRRIPFFWGGGDLWRVRYSSALIGEHKYATVCDDESNVGLHGVTGSINILPYEGDNELFKHGSPAMSADRRYLEHRDDKRPFFWLADTWWLGLTTRLSWPDGFRELTADRVNKGFNVVQIAAGLYPEMKPFDKRGANEKGFPWDPEFKSINPGYFDAADLKISWLVENGIVPCVVGCWGYFADKYGVRNIKRHWDYLIARWGAYPVVWCAAGEANLRFYDELEWPGAEEYLEKSRADWTEITSYIKECDPFERLLTIHPTKNGHEQVNDEKLLDLDMLQIAHGSFISLVPAVKQVKKALDRKSLPVINAESCYEGICGSSWADVQRYSFWSSVLLGCCGHTYGADGIWQPNSIGEPFRQSPYNASTGDMTWQEACRLPGSSQLGAGKKLLCELPWHRFEYRPDWIEANFGFDGDTLSGGAFAAGVQGECRVIFLPILGEFFSGDIKVLNVEPNTYRTYRFDTIGGKRIELGNVEPDGNGVWHAPKVDKYQDWVLVMVRRG